MSEGVDIVAIEDTPDDNGANWNNAFIRLGELDVVSVSDMVNKVIAKSNGRLIGHLTIIGHGSGGNQSVGDGQKFDPTGNRSLTIDVNTGALVGGAETDLVRLAGKFAPEAIVTLRGCNVALGDFGKMLLKRVSNLLGGVTVEGSEDLQYAGWSLEGTVIRCKRDTCWVAQTGKGAGGKACKK
jgi:hypothetical protein